MNKVAVVIPCRNERAYIEKCVRSVLHSDYPAGLLRILVCDGKSTDGTVEIVQQISKSDPRVELLRNEQQTTPYALNLGIKYAVDCNVHIILGAHAEIAPDYIRLCVENLKNDPSVGCVGGILQNVNEDSTSEMIGKAMSSSFGVGNAHFRTGAKSGYVDTVAFGAYRKEVFEKAGYFDEELTRNQDDEFNYRVTKNGFKILLDPAIRAKYYVRAAFGKLLRQYYQYGFWKVYVNRKHKAVTSYRQLVPPLFVLFMMTAVAIPFVPFYWIVWCGIFFLYLAAAFTAALAQKGRIGEIPGVVFAFMLLHLGYGFGYIRGMVRFILLGMKPQEKHSSTSR
ncbi:MAG TPA: glycosyltransferase family 2 protein [Bacteroidia bacterium]|nr:glycosyltransferase family 2 protein [Bacteroidia bacterium]